MVVRDECVCFFGSVFNFLKVFCKYILFIVIDVLIVFVFLIFLMIGLSCFCVVLLLINLS